MGQTGLFVYYRSFHRTNIAQILTIKIVILGGNLRKVKDLVVT